MTRIIWPENRMVSDGELIRWAQDVFADGFFDEREDYRPDSVETAREFLELTGDVTFYKK